MTLNQLFEAAKLSSFVSRDMGWFSGNDNEGSPTWNHWSGALQELKTDLGRRLTDAEVCVLSLSLGFGPTPGIDHDRSIRYRAILWPRGNTEGCFVHPLRVVECLAWADQDQDVEKAAWEKLKKLCPGEEPLTPQPVYRRSRRLAR